MNGSIEIIAGIVRSSLEIPLSILACKVRIGPKAVLMLCLGPSPSRMFGWLFNNTKGSVLMTLIAHAADGLVITGNLGLNAINSERQIMLLVATWCVTALVVVILYGPTLTRKPKYPRAPEPTRSPFLADTVEKLGIAGTWDA